MKIISVIITESNILKAWIEEMPGRFKSQYLKFGKTWAEKAMEDGDGFC